SGRPPRNPPRRTPRWGLLRASSADRGKSWCPRATLRRGWRGWRAHARARPRQEAGASLRGGCGPWRAAVEGLEQVFEHALMRGELEGFWIVARVPRPQLVALGAGLAAPGREDALVARDAAAVLRRAGARTVDQNGRGALRRARQ